MQLYFLRHGDASSHSRYSDSDRPLTDLGIRQAMLVGTLLQRTNAVIDTAISSPLKRAQETASIVLSTIGKKLITCSDLLINGSDPQQLFHLLDELRVSTVLLIGHEPSFSELISLLIDEKKNVEIEMRKCSLALVKISNPIHPGTGVLQFLIPVETLV
jgi:phosphohistidine phosphatase